MYAQTDSPFSPGLCGDMSRGELPVVERLSLTPALLGRAAAPFSPVSVGSSANTSRLEPNASRERARYVRRGLSSNFSCMMTDSRAIAQLRSSDPTTDTSKKKSISKIINSKQSVRATCTHYIYARIPLRMRLRHFIGFFYAVLSGHL